MFRGDSGDQAGPLAGVVIGQQRKWRDLAGPVARGTVLVKDRCDVLVEGRSGGACKARQQQSLGHDDDKSHNSPSCDVSMMKPTWIPVRPRLSAVCKDLSPGLDGLARRPGHPTGRTYRR